MFFESARNFLQSEIPTVIPLLQKTPCESKALRGHPDPGEKCGLDDLNRGKPHELNHLSGDVVRIGCMRGIASSFHEFVTAALQPYVNGPPG